MKFIDADNNIAIRGMVAEDGIDYFLSVFDFVNNACGRNTSSDYGRNLFNRLISDKSDYQSELLTLCKYRQFTGIFLLTVNEPTACCNFKPVDFNRLTLNRLILNG